MAPFVRIGVVLIVFTIEDFVTENFIGANGETISRVDTPGEILVFDGR